MIKPCTGYTPGMKVELFRAAAMGGCDIIKDDERASRCRITGGLEEKSRLDFLQFPGILPALCTLRDRG
jgi:2,3-diketo-5-methylthiopentyl-1-phosphate enolase